MGSGGRLAVAASLGGLGAVDIGLRVAPDLLGIGESIVIPALLGVTAQAIVSSPVVGTLVGAVMLAAPVAYLTPALFPRAFLTSRRNLLVRGFVGLSALVVALYAREAILVVVTGEPSWTPVTPSVWSATRILAAVAAGLAVLLLVPWDRFGTTPERMSSGDEKRRQSDGSTATRLEPDRDGDSDTDPDGGSTLDPWQRSIDELDPPLGLLATGTLLIVGVGVVLATVSLLYPIPELLAIGAGLYVAASPNQSRTTDVVEPLILAVRSIWDGVAGATVFVYTVVVLYILSVAGAWGVVSVFSRVGPAGGVFYTTAVLVPIAYAVKYVERSYRSVLTRGEVHVPWGAMVPVGVLSGLHVGAQKAGFGGEGTEVVAAWTTPVWTVAIVGGAVTLLLSFLPGGRGLLLTVAAAAMNRDGDEDGSANSSAPTVAIPAGVVGLIVAQVVTRDLVAYHLTSAMTAVGVLRRLAVAVLSGAFAAAVVLVVPWAAVSVLASLFGTLSSLTPRPLRRLLGS